MVRRSLRENIGVMPLMAETLGLTANEERPEMPPGELTERLYHLGWLRSANVKEVSEFERLAMVDADTINYEATIADPTIYTRPWKMAFGWSRIKPGDQSLFGPVPPATRTRPSFSSATACGVRGVAIEPVGVNLPVAGS